MFTGENSLDNLSDEELVKKIRALSRESSFRNKSHLVEEAIKRFLETK